MSNIMQIYLTCSVYHDALSGIGKLDEDSVLVIGSWLCFWRNW